MRIEVMSARGDDLLAEWSAQTTAAELKAIGDRFDALRRSGYRAFGAVSGQRVERFAREIDEDLVLIAPMVGG